MPEKIPLLDLTRQYMAYREEIDEALLAVAHRANYILGPEVSRFEEAAAKYLGTKDCLGVASGTDALVISLRALAIKTKGREYFTASDEIITTPFTFTATGGAILRAGATPVFVDIEPDSFNLEPGAVKKAVNQNTVGIIPVHLYGQACAMDDLITLARENNLFVLEDVAQAFGATYRGQKLGSLGDMAAFSFFPSKNLGAFGDGGLVATGDSELYELARMLSKHGGNDKYNVYYLGYNSRLDTLQASVLLVKLKYVDHLNKLRRALAGTYNSFLAGLNGIALPPEKEPGHVYHQYTVRVKEVNRDRLQQRLKQAGVATAVYYPILLSEMQLYRGRCRVPFELEQAEKACREVLSLPVEPLLTEQEIADVVRAITAALQ